MVGFCHGGNMPASHHHHDHHHDHHQLLGGDDCNSDAPAVVSSSLKDSDESKTKDKSKKTLLKSPSSLFCVHILKSQVTTGESLPSETLIAWTDPAFPAFVEAPTIHPINMVTEVKIIIVAMISIIIVLWKFTPFIQSTRPRPEVKLLRHNEKSNPG